MVTTSSYLDALGLDLETPATSLTLGQLTEIIRAAAAESVRTSVAIEVAPLRQAFEDQARRFELLRACFRDVTLSKAEAAQYVGVSTRTIDRKVSSEELHAVPGGRRRFTLDELDRAVHEGAFA